MKPSSARGLSARRIALLATTIAGVGAAAFVVAPDFNLSATYPTAHAQNLTEQAHKLPAPQGFADIVEKVKPSVISVRVKINGDKDKSAENSQVPPNLRDFFRRFGLPEPGEGMPHGRGGNGGGVIMGQGSGFFISADGFAVTNNHVVENADSVKVATDNGKTYTAKVIGTDAKTDLALIKVDGKSDFPYVNLETATPRVGDWVVAVGNPYGLGGTVTAGIISAEGRDIGSGPYDDYIQIDAPINKGNSGGPTFDTKGNVIGVNTAIFSPSGGSVGIGFDIPASTVKMVVAQLKDTGTVTRAYIGVEVQPVTAGIAESLGMKNAAGALVDQAQPNTPAAKAGVQAGDVITAVNGNPVKDSRSLAREISVMAPGSTAKLDILRKGEQKSIEVTLAKMPSQPEKQANAGEMENGSSPHLGISVAPASDVAGAGSKGLVITAVDPDGPAAEHGLNSGDVILDVGGKSVSSASELRHALSAAKSDGKHDVLMRVKSADNTHFVAMPIG